MAIIIHTGKLTKWFGDKGYGFISPHKGSKNVFLHISNISKEMPRRPKVGDTIYYHLHTDQNGKEMALNAKIKGAAKKPNPSSHQKRPASHRPKPKPKRTYTRSLTYAGILLLFGFFYVMNLYNSSDSNSKADNTSNFTDTTTYETGFECDGRTHCSEMSSCEEAKFFLSNCPGAKMDGNNDGVPCEKQWCF